LFDTDYLPVTHKFSTLEKMLAFKPKSMADYTNRTHEIPRLADQSKFCGEKQFYMNCAKVSL